ncbi:DUF1778 domain-containing protein [Thiospirochaeta perfilievii]
MEEVESLHASDSDRDLFYSLLTDPPTPNDNLKNLFRLK